jgi:hypothetical protein
LFVPAQVATVVQFRVIALIVAVVTGWIGFSGGSVGTPVLLVSNLVECAADRASPCATTHPVQRRSPRWWFGQSSTAAIL